MTDLSINTFIFPSLRAAKRRSNLLALGDCFAGKITLLATLAPHRAWRSAGVTGEIGGFR
ncbi:MAG: hypothetical protein AB1750_11235 [Chloroflexota bacterium]